MTGQDHKNPQARATASGQDVVVELTIPVDHLRAARWDHDPTYGPAEPLVVETRLTREDLDPWHSRQGCCDGSCGYGGDPKCEELLESVVNDLHRLAHNDAGDTDDAARCLRYPCRRLSE